MANVNCLFGSFLITLPVLIFMMLHLPALIKQNDLRLSVILFAHIYGIVEKQQGSFKQSRLEYKHVWDYLK